VAQHDILDHGNEYLLKIKQGNKKTFLITVKNSLGVVVDLSSATAIYFTAKRTADDPDIDAVVTKNVFGSVGQDLVNGVIAIALVGADTSAVEAACYLWDLKIVGGTYDGRSLPEFESMFVVLPAIRKT
jgi:hypothetical protein